MDNRIELIAEAILDGLSVYQIRDIAEVKSWNLSRSSIDKYCRKARELIVKTVENNRDKMIELGLAKYDRIYRRAIASGNLKEANNAVTNQMKLVGAMQTTNFIQQNNQINYGSPNELGESEKITRLIEEFAEKSIEACDIESDFVDALSH